MICSKCGNKDTVYWIVPHPAINSQTITIRECKCGHKWCKE